MTPHPPEMEELAATEELESVGPAPRGLDEKNGHHLRPSLGALPAAHWPRRPADWLRVLGVPLLAALVCGAGAFAAASLSTQWYRSVATLYFPSTGNQGAANIIGMLSASGSLAMPTDSAGAVPLAGGIVTSPLVASGPNTAMMVLSSGRCQSEVMQRCNLAARWHLPPGKAAERLLKNVSYSVNKDGLLAIQASDPDPKLSTQIVDTYVHSLRRIANELSTEGSSRNLRFLTTELAAVRKYLHGQQARLVALQELTGKKLPLSVSPTSVGTAYSDLVSQKNTAQVELDATDAAIAYQNRAAKLTETQGQNLSASVPFAQDARERLSKAETDFAVAKATLGPDNANYQTLQAQVAQAQADVKAETRRALAAVQQGISPTNATLYADRASQTAKVDGLTQALSQIQSQMVAMPSLQMQQTQLTSDIEVNQQLLATLQGEVWRARIAEDRNLPTFMVVDAAGVPTDPYAPRIGFVTACAAVAGLLLSLAWNAARSVLRQPLAVYEMPRTGQTELIAK